MNYRLMSVLILVLGVPENVWCMQGQGAPVAEKKEVAVEGLTSSEKETMKTGDTGHFIVDAQVTPGIYVHFKNPNHRYEVVAVARYSEDPHQEFVVYKSLYESELKPEGTKLPSGTLWVRPKSMFLELVADPTDKTKKVPRFKKIS